jgi:ribosomal protein L18
MHPQSTIRLLINISNRHTKASLFKKLNPSDSGSHIAVITTVFPAVEALLADKGIKASTKDASAVVGQLLAERAKMLGVSAVELSRKRDLAYHGKVKAVIDALRENGVAVH